MKQKGSIKILFRSLVIMTLLFVLSFPAFAVKEIELTSSQLTLDYSDRSRGDTYSDTLVFYNTIEGKKQYIRPLDTESTCDCVLPAIHTEENPAYSKGFLSFDFHVLAAEEDGPNKKVIYVFIENEKFDVVRLTLTSNILPGGAEEGDSTFHTSENNFKSSGDLRLLYFYSPNCKICQGIKNEVLPQILEKWQGKISLEEINTEYEESLLRLLDVREYYGGNRGGTFSFYVGDSQVTGNRDIFNRLDSAIQKALDNNEKTYLGTTELDQTLPGLRKTPFEKAKEVFQSFTFWAIIGAGLLDGINPCAFATIVFFISLLNYAGSTKKQIVIVGTGFTLSVFAVYLLLGLGAFKALQALAIYSIISKIILIVTFGLLVFLFILSLRDTIQYYRTGKTTNQVLQLSRENKKRIHGVMRRGLKTGNLLLGSIGIGALVTLFEAACTGQVYLPTIVLVMKDPAMQANAILYLVLYNFLFVLPLIIVFLLAYGGVASEKFGQWSKHNFGITRIALSLLFLSLAIIMIKELLTLF